MSNFTIIAVIIIVVVVVIVSYSILCFVLVSVLYSMFPGRLI